MICFSATEYLSVPVLTLQMAKTDTINETYKTHVLYYT